MQHLIPLWNPSSQHEAGECSELARVKKKKKSAIYGCIGWPCLLSCQDAMEPREDQYEAVKCTSFTLTWQAYGWHLGQSMAYVCIDWWTRLMHTVRASCRIRLSWRTGDRILENQHKAISWLFAKKFRRKIASMLLVLLSQRSCLHPGKVETERNNKKIKDPNVSSPEILR